MKKILLVILFAFSAQATDIKISDIYIRPALSKNHATTLYLNIENTSNEIDYLIGAELTDNPEARISINKTVIEKNIARIINIDKLAIPPRSLVKLAPLGIYLVIKNGTSSDALKIRFIFRNHTSLVFVKGLLTNIR